MRLKLECKMCGKRFKVEVGRIFVESSHFGKGEKRDRDIESAVCFGREVRCPRCGDVDEYRLTTNASIHLVVEILKILEKGLPPYSEYAEGKHEIVVAEFGLKDGTRMLPREAEKFYRKRLAEDSENSKLHLRLGNVLKFMGRVQEALVEYQKTLEIDQNEPEAWYNTGVLCKRLGGLGDAEEALLKCIESATKNLDKDRKFYEELMVAAKEELHSIMKQIDT